MIIYNTLDTTMSLLEAVISTLSPAECLICSSEGASLCKTCAARHVAPFGERCWRCQALNPNGRTCIHCRSFSGPRHVWIVTNYETAAAELVRAFKFGQLRVAGESLARLMIETLNGFSYPDDYLIVPVPTATSRARRRGFDQGQLLARQIARRLNRPSLPALARLGQSRQVGATRAERLTQSAGAYRLRLPRDVAGRSILLVDDVLTTGATLREATRTLRAGGARRVDALLFAKRQ